MSISSTAALRTLVAAGLALAITSCWNGNGAMRNDGVIGGTARLQMIIDDERTAYYLLDTATGDLWRLQPEGEKGQWNRVAEGPADLRQLSLAQILGHDSDDE